MLCNPRTPFRHLVIIPLYNEEKTVVRVLNQIRKFYHNDILIVDDGSTDRSIPLIWKNHRRRVEVIHHSSNQGYGKSLLDAFTYAISNDYDDVVTMDCDAQHEPAYLPQFFAALKNVDIVSGSRYLPNSRVIGKPPQDRPAINLTVSEWINRLTQFDITDAFCGFKAYQVSALNKFSLTEMGYAFPLQLWIQAYFLGMKVKEIAVDRIYFHVRRSFGAELDDPSKRLHYYQQILEQEKQKWQSM